MRPGHGVNAGQGAAAASVGFDWRAASDLGHRCVTYTARVRVTVTAGELTPLVREGTGAGHGIDADMGQAHESAIKEAETDAMKRALMTFGNPFGLALYDKQQREVTSSAAPTPVPSANPSSRPAKVAPRRESQSTAQPEVDPSLDPLDPVTIQQILDTRSWPTRPHSAAPGGHR